MSMPLVSGIFCSHLIRHEDGATTGPKSFDGPICREASGDIHLPEVVNFNPISTSNPVVGDEIWKDLSGDQQLLYSWSRGVSDGVIPDKLVHQKPGPPNHARWLTLAIRILMMYAKTQDPSPSLIRIVTFIQQVKKNSD